MIHIEYRYPWTGAQWRRYAVAANLEGALDLLDGCRENHPGGECRLREERNMPQGQACVAGSLRRE